MFSTGRSMLIIAVISGWIPTHQKPSVTSTSQTSARLVKPYKSHSLDHKRMYNCCRLTRAVANDTRSSVRVRFLLTSVLGDYISSVRVCVCVYV